MFRELAAARIRRSMHNGVLTAVASLLATALAAMALLTAIAVVPSYTQLHASLGAPDLFLTVGAADVRSAERVVDEYSAALRHSRAEAVVDGTVSSEDGSRSAPVLLMRGAPDTTHWLSLQQGVARTPPDGVSLERGLAHSLHVGVGGDVSVRGPAGDQRLIVTSIVGDLSTDTYPGSGQGTAYLSARAASVLGLASAPAVRIPIWSTSHSAHPSASTALAGRLKSAGVSGQLQSLSSSVDGVSLIASLTAVTVAIFGIAAWISALLFMIASIRLRVLRSERELGGLLAVGWTAGRLRALLAVEQLPFVVVGAACGALVGTLGAQLLTAQLTLQFGAPSIAADYLGYAFAIGALFMVAAGAAVWALSRRLGTVAPAVLLRRGLSLSRRRTSGGRLRHVSVSRVGFMLARERPGRSAMSIAMVSLAIVVGIFAVSALETLRAATGDPATWGLSYEYQVTVPAGVDASTVAREARALGGVSAAVAVTGGTADIGDVPTYLQAAPVSQTELTPTFSAGRLPADDRQIAVGSGLASQLGVQVGDDVAVGDGARRYQVSGVYVAAGEAGAAAIGPEAVAADMLPGAQPVVLVAASPTAVLATELHDLDGGSLPVATAESQIALPFAATLRAMLAALAVGLGCLACAVAVSTTSTTGAELVPTIGLLRSIGASARDLRSVIVGYTAAVTAPAIVIGTTLGIVAASSVLPTALESFGLRGAQIPILTCIMVVVSAAVVSVLGTGVPIWQRMRVSAARMLN